MKNERRLRRGAGLTEYVIVVVLVALALVTTIMFFGTEVIHGYGGIAAPALESLETAPPE